MTLRRLAPPLAASLALALVAVSCGATPPPASGAPASGVPPSSAVALGTASQSLPPGSRPAVSLSPSATVASPSATVASPSPPASPDGTVIPTARLQAAIDRFVRRTGTPGVSVTLRWADGRSWTGVSGLADVATALPVTPQTAFPIASVSKTFTAALVLRLVEEGRLSLEASAARFLPDLGLDRRITIRMLLDHTSGLADVFLAPGIDRALQSHPARRWTVQRSLSYLGRRWFAPGKGWRYSNTNYLLLGLIADKVTGRSLATELRSRFLRPLGLRETWDEAAEAPRTPLAHGYAVSGTTGNWRARDLADGTDRSPFTSVVTALEGAGSIAATSADLAEWASALYVPGAVLSASTLSAALADAHVTRDYVPGVRYGLGVQELTVDGWATLGHSGRILGARSQMRYVPAAGLAIAIVTNQSRRDLRPLLARLLGIVLPPTAPVVDEG
ncbi:MAG TPA: serine hydrolase [Candidatus Limnocylindrales bacterium]|nr:serine hydrolase [Candidatus Limnocylindrales bacterium]